MSQDGAKPQHQNPECRTHSLMKAALLFLLIFVVLEIGYNTLRETVVTRVIIDQLTVSTSATLIKALDPMEPVIAQHNRIVSPSTQLIVNIGCEGTETLLLLVAAITVLSISWKHKIIGMLAGCLLVYVLNLARIITLFFALKYNKPLFDTLHSFIAPLIIVLVVGSCFGLWLSAIAPNANANDTRLVR